VVAFTDPGRLNTRDTVDFDTAAWVATSSIVAIQLPPNVDMTQDHLPGCCKCLVFRATL
jgi:hypothetical protein